MPQKPKAKPKQSGKAQKPEENSAALYISAHEGEEDYADIQVCLLWHYAASHNMQIVGIYSDLGAKREKQQVLKKLLADIHSGKANFTQILLMNPQKWNGSSSISEHDYCESVCKNAGVEVRYAFPSAAPGSGPCSIMFRALRRAAEAQEQRWGLNE